VKWVVGSLAAGLAALVAGGAVAQTPCMVVAARDAAYKVENREPSHTGKRFFESCASVEALEKPIEVCYEDAQRRAECRKVVKGAPFTRAADASARMRPTWRKVSELLSGGPTVAVAGVKRAHDGERRAGFPYGAVLPTATGLQIAPAGYGSLDLFVVEREKPSAAPVLRAQNLALPASIPAAALQPGATYKWQVRAGGDQFSGGYNVLAERFVAEVERRLAVARADAQLSDDARRILEAEVYEDFGLLLERDRALAGLQ
jgi:hypothetical protein